jgi:hypothetical protein
MQVNVILQACLSCKYFVDPLIAPPEIMNSPPPRVVDRLRSMRRHGHMSFDNFPDKQAMGSNHARVA